MHLHLCCSSQVRCEAIDVLEAAVRHPGDGGTAFSDDDMLSMLSSLSSEAAAIAIDF